MVRWVFVVVGLVVVAGCGPSLAERRQAASVEYQTELAELESLKRDRDRELQDALRVQSDLETTLHQALEFSKTSVSSGRDISPELSKSLKESEKLLPLAEQRVQEARAKFDGAIAQQEAKVAKAKAERDSLGAK